MGLVSKGSSVVENGTEAAVVRLQNVKNTSAVEIAKPVYKQRDFDAEARGKTRCVQFEAALMSPAIAGLKFNNLEEYLELVRQAADAGVAYTFNELK